MVALADYVRRNTGIDIEQSCDRQNVDDLDAVLVRNQRSDGDFGPRHAPMPTQALYDAVVGIESQRGHGFDAASHLPARLNPAQLNHIVGATNQMFSQSRNMPSTQRSDEREKMLVAIATEAGKYRDLLTGANGRNGVKKSANMGNRHTLIRGNAGAVFEMTNSMTDTEITRFRRKTRLPIQAVLKPEASKNTGDERFWKIAIGEGGFGKARIARNIGTDDYVAVKKCHPKFALINGKLESISHGTLFSSRVSPRGIASLRRLGDFVISPVDERVCISTKSLKHKHQAESFNQFNSMQEMQFIQSAVAFAEDPQIVKVRMENETGLVDAIIGARCEPAQVRVHENTFYSFSELGLASVDSVLDTLTYTRANLESARSSHDLSERVLRDLARFAQENDRAPRPSFTAEQVKQLRREQAPKIFDAPQFVLKDRDTNDKYRNTLARKMLQAIAAMHVAQLAHMDV